MYQSFVGKWKEYNIMLFDRLLTEKEIASRWGKRYGLTFKWIQAVNCNPTNQLIGLIKKRIIIIIRNLIQEALDEKYKF